MDINIESNESKIENSSILLNTAGFIPKYTLPIFLKLGDLIIWKIMFWSQKPQMMTRMIKQHRFYMIKSQ